MALGDVMTFPNGSYEVRAIVDGRYVVRIRERKRRKETYRGWTESERHDFDQSQRIKEDKADRNSQIYERLLAGETMASLAREFGLSPTTIGQIRAKRARIDRRGNGGMGRNEP